MGKVVKSESQLPFLIWRLLFTQGRTVSELVDTFDETIDRINAALRKLERMGFAYRVRSGTRANGIVWAATTLTPGEAIERSTV